MNNHLEIGVIDMPAENGASHAYLIVGADMRANPSFEIIDAAAKTVPGDAYMLIFQQGDPDIVGMNGLTHEVLLAGMIDHMSALQNGPEFCQEREDALSCLRLAAEALNIKANREYLESLPKPSEI